MNNNRSVNTNHKIYRRLFILSLISIASIFIGYFVIVLWWFPEFSQSASGTRDWSLLEGFASVLSLSLLAGGLIFAVTEYINTENAKQREKAKLSYEIYNAIYDKLTDPRQEAARRWILSNIKIKETNQDITGWYEETHSRIMEGAIGSPTGLPEGQHAVKLTLNCFDYIGFIADHFWDMEDDSLDWISAPIAKVWRRIGPYVLHVRKLRNTTDYYLFAERVGELCIDWRINKGLPDEDMAPNTL